MNALAVSFVGTLLREKAGLPAFWADFLDIAFWGGAVLMNFVAVYAGVCTYVERKIAARMQARVGPYQVGPHGVLQWLADALKLLTKEDIIPTPVDRFLFKFAPYLIMAGAFAAWVALPYAEGWSPGNLNIGILYILAMGSSAVLAILMAGWASANKWALFGAMRSAAQIVSYEVPMGLTILAGLMMAGSLNLHDISAAQAKGFAYNLWADEPLGALSWFAFRHFPFTLVAVVVMFICGLAETNRTPFDIPEAESELVAGYHTEYSGMRFSFFFLAEYASMFVVAAMVVTLFLGGWLPPFSTLESAALSGVGAIALGIAGKRMEGSAVGFLVGALVGGGLGQAAGLFVDFLGGRRFTWIAVELLHEPDLRYAEGAFWFLSKTLALIFVMMWLRWTLPRYRVDQLMDLCWKRLVPLAFVNFLAIGALEALTPWLWTVLGTL
jgi:NADH-quinone oxidoreductase subunit H